MKPDGVCQLHWVKNRGVSYGIGIMERNEHATIESCRQEFPTYQRYEFGAQQYESIEKRCNVVRLVSDPIYDKTIERSQVMIR